MLSIAGVCSLLVPHPSVKQRILRSLHIPHKRWELLLPCRIIIQNHVCVCPQPGPRVAAFRPGSINQHLPCDLRCVQPLNQPQLAERGLCPLYPDLGFSPVGLFTADQCVPIDPHLKVTGIPHEYRSRRMQERQDNSLWTLDLARPLAAGLYVLGRKGRHF